MFAIETNVPMPRRQAKNQRYPWHELGVGQSFFVPLGNFNSLRASACTRGKRMKCRFTTRQVEGGVRVWRVE